MVLRLIGYGLIIIADFGAISIFALLVPHTNQSKKASHRCLTVLYRLSPKTQIDL